MSIENKGNQVVSFDFKAPAKGQEFNKYNRELVKPGIYKGGTVTKVSNNTIEIATFHAFFNTGDSQGVHVNTEAVVQHPVYKITSSNAYVYMTYAWENVIENWIDFAVRDGATGAETNEVLLCEITFDSSGYIDTIDDAVRTYGTTYTTDSQTYAHHVGSFYSSDLSVNNIFEATAGQGICVCDIMNITDRINTGCVLEHVPGAGIVVEDQLLKDSCHKVDNIYGQNAGLVNVEGACFATGGNVTIPGNLTITGTTTSVNTTNTDIEDNVILLNSGEGGAGVTEGSSGLQIDRGSCADALLHYDETDNIWRCGFTGYTCVGIGVPAGSIIPWVGGYWEDDGGGKNNNNTTYACAVTNTIAGTNAYVNKYGYYVADGTAPNISDSPIYNASNKYLPNLTGDIFLMGSTCISSGQGGENINTHNHTFAHTHTTCHCHNVSHQHVVSHAHTTTTWNCSLNLAHGHSNYGHSHKWYCHLSTTIADYSWCGNGNGVSITYDTTGHGVGAGYALISARKLAWGPGDIRETTLSSQTNASSCLYTNLTYTGTCTSGLGTYCFCHGHTANTCSPSTTGGITWADAATNPTTDSQNGTMSTPSDSENRPKYITTFYLVKVI